MYAVLLDCKHSLRDAFQCIAQPNTALHDCILYLTYYLWSRHFTGLCKSVHPCGRVYEIQSIKGTNGRLLSGSAKLLLPALYFQWNENFDSFSNHLACLGLKTAWVWKNVLGLWSSHYCELNLSQVTPPQLQCMYHHKELLLTCGVLKLKYTNIQ